MRFHVLQFGAGRIGERLPIGGVLPAVARDAECATDAARGEDDGFRAEEPEAAPFAVVPECAHHALAILEQGDDRDFHVHVDGALHRLVLQRADHLEAGAITDVRQPRVTMPTKIALEDAAVGSAIEHRAPCLELAHAIRRLLCVQFRHAPVVEILAATHRVGEVHHPVVTIVDIAHGRRGAAFRHHGVCLPQERLADHPDRRPRLCRADCSPQPRSSRADHEHVVLECLHVVHHRIRQSCHTPVAHRRT